MASYPIRTHLAVAGGLFAAGLSKRLGRGEGSVIGGRVSLVIDPRSLERLAQGRDVVLVSATNGKTTTTAMAATALKTMGHVVTNSAGANMFGGMVSALSAHPAAPAVLEVDEGHLPKALIATKPRVVILLNLTRDQLDRVGEVRMQAQKWRESLQESDAVVIANCDDPMVVWSAQSASTKLWISAGNNWRHDAVCCPSCGERIVWQESDWKCEGCDLKRPEPHAWISHAEGDAPDFEPVFAFDEMRVPLDLTIPGEVNRANAAFALLGAVLLGASPSAASRAICAMSGTGGRFSSVEISGHACRLMLAKNPAGWNEALRILRDDESPVVVAINSQVQDGRDPSWLWDVPFEKLQGRFVVATGERGRDLSVRLKYADIDHIFESDYVKAIATASQRAGGAEIDVMGNYSAFQDIRKKATTNTNY